MALDNVPSDVPIHVSKTIALDGSAGAGAIGTVAVWTITGTVIFVRHSMRCTEDLVSAAAGNLQYGDAGSANRYITSTVATAIDINMFWLNATPQSRALALPAPFKEIMLGPDGDTIITVTDGAVTDGTFVADAWYLPVSSDGAVS